MAKTPNVDELTATVMQAVMAALGQTSVPSTAQAAVRETSDKAPLKAKGKMDDVVVFVTQAMADSRMKLPAKMFNGKSVMYVDDYKIASIESDRGRSTKLSPSDYFNADPGDTITFTHLGGNKWDYEVEEGTAADRKRAQIDGRTGEEKPKAKAKPSNAKAPKSSKTAKVEAVPTKASKAKQAVRDAEVDEDTVPDKKAIKRFIAKYADMAIDNHDEDPKFRNVNITSSNTKAQLGLDRDARELLTSKQSQAFRRERKRMGISLKKAITLLNAAVYE